MRRTTRFAWILLLVIPVALGLFRLRLDTEVLNLLPPDLPVVQGLKIYQERFADADELLITLRATDAEIAAAAAEAVAAKLRPLTNDIRTVHWQAPWQENPALAAELLAYIWLNRSPDEFAGALAKYEFPQATNALAQARERLATSFSPADIALASYDPLGLSELPSATGMRPAGFGPDNTAFGSADGTFRLVLVQSRHPLKTYKQCQAWLQTVRAAARATLAQDFPGVKVGFTGRPAFTAEIAGGMEFDMTVSIIGTSVIIAILFWLFHRRFRPMLWLLTLLGIILLATLGLGGLLFGTINIIAVGFAAILLGLAVDYAVVHYQEALEHPSLSIPQIRRAIAPSITWAAVTTMVAFLVLNFGGLPGLAQLGTLVAVGVAVSALVMIFAYLPPLFPGRTQATANPANEEARFSAGSPIQIGISLGLGLLLLPAILLWKGLPGVDPSAEPLRPASSEAYTAMEEIKRELTGTREPLWLLVTGADYEELARRMTAAEDTLQRAKSSGLVKDFTLPTLLLPRPELQQKNLAALRRLGDPDLIGAATAQGFSSNAVGLAEAVLRVWREAARRPAPFLPTNDMSRFVLQRALSSGETPAAVGLIQPMPDAPPTLSFDTPGVILSGWELLGNGIYQRVRQNLFWLLVPVVMLVLGSLWLAFRNWREIAMSAAVLGLSGALLLGVMSLVGWSWNLLNLMAIPLIIGTGVDYSIFTQLALRRHGGDRARAYRSVGRALLLCGGTAIAGFGSLAWSGNLGMAGLGKVCATGIALNMLISVYLLPHWWARLAGRRGAPAASSFYSVTFWKAGLALAKWIPHRWLELVARTVLLVYWALAAHRRKTVFNNLLPVFGGDAVQARRATRRLFANFGVKLVDLWRNEAGTNIEDLFGHLNGWEHFVAAREGGRGVLLVTVHHGNWEFGGPCLTRKGVSLQILTLAEPGEHFTALRQASRARWKVDTIVVRNDPFAFLEPVRRLQSGAAVALLIDRPPPPTAVEARLFGRAIQVSNAAAELARASGCAVLPVCVWREAGAYSVEVMPPVPYERARLRDRAIRQQFTQAILDRFAPRIGEHPDQWYHFVPVWPEAKQPQ